MTNTLEKSQERSERPIDPALMHIGKRTRDRVFGTLGKAVDIGTDATVFGMQTAGYVVGQGIYGTATGAREIMRGMRNQPFNRAA